MNEFIQFLKHPRIIKPVYSINWNNFFTLLFLVFFIHIPFGLIIHGIESVANTQVLRDSKAISYYQYLLKGLVMAPLIEEVLFRLPLIPTRRNNIIFILTITFILCINIYKSISLIYIAAPMLLILIYLLFLVLHKYHRINFFSDNHFKYLFFTSVLLFGLFHMFNFRIDSIIVILLVIPQIIDGAILGYIRLKYGFVYAVIFHVIINSFGLLKYM